MDRIKITAGDLMHVYGSQATGVDYTVRLCLRMTDSVEEKALRKAVSATEKRYPYLCVTLKEDSREYYYVRNQTPVQLIRTSERIRLNDPVSGGHVWAVCYDDDRIFLDFYHGIADGAGMYTVLSTLLYYYCRECYGTDDHEGIRTLEDEIPTVETDDPLDACPPITLSSSEAKEPPHAFSLIEDAGMSLTDVRYHDIEIPEEAFLKFAFENDASPGTMIALLTARAIDGFHPIRNKPITGAYVVNTRPMIGAPLNHHNCLSTVRLEYTDRIRKMPLMTQCTVYRGKTILQSDSDNIIPVMAAYAGRNKAIEAAFPLREAREKAFYEPFDCGNTYFTYLVSYVGKWRYDQIGQHIREFYTHAPATFYFLLEISAVNGRLFLTVQQRFAEDRYLEALLKQFDENGIPYRISRSGKGDNAAFSGPYKGE
ncbi:MAG: hypothetical protein IJL40_04765 [Oscillospiraceae bacterium]|nr:hypothetical protein [Oscillospiraceae bacterium]